MGPLMALGEEAIVPALDYLFHRVEQGFDGSPTLHDPRRGVAVSPPPDLHAPAAGLAQDAAEEERLRRLRHPGDRRRGRQPDPPDHPSACPTKIYLPNEEALTPHIAPSYAGFGLTETEIAILAQAQKKRDYYYRSVRGRRLFTLDLGPVALAFVAMSSPADQRFLDGLVASAAPEQYAELILRHRGLGGGGGPPRCAYARQPPPYSISGGNR